MSDSTTPDPPPADVPPAGGPAAEAAPTPPTEHAPPPAPPAPPAPSPAPWRYWPDSLVGRILVVVTTLAFIVFLVDGMRIRFHGIFDPWALDGDQAQAVWQYWRYKVSGAFPPGDLLTDYAFVMHAPPVWWALMATLSSMIGPLWAAKTLNLVAYVVTCVAMYVAVTPRSNHFVGIAACALLVRTPDFHGIIAGGYARSFGPLLVLLFLGAFLRRRHKLTLGILVLQAAFYPSVVMPCGFAYGIFVCVAGPMRVRLRRMAGMFVAGLLIIGFGKYQDIQAPAWWGSVVTLEQALKMPSWGPGGRIHEAPLRPWPGELDRHCKRAFIRGGHVLAPRLGARMLAHHGAGWLTFFALGLAACAAIAAYKRRRGQRFEDMVPWELLLLFASAVVAYFFARVFAFKFYLPYRPLQHVTSYVTCAAMPLLWWAVLRNVVRWRLVASCAALVLAVVPMFAMYGDGLSRQPATYFTTRGEARLYAFVRTLPLTSQLAGQFYYADRIPLFAYHRVYVTKNLAHPFRPGYFKENERRIRLVYGDLLYGTNLADIVARARQEKIDYLVYNANLTTRVDTKLFAPMKRDLARIFLQNKKKGFAIPRAPKSAIVYAVGNDRVLSIEKLAQALAKGEVTPEAPPPPPPFIGPMPEPKPSPEPAGGPVRATPLQRSRALLPHLIGRRPPSAGE